MSRIEESKGIYIAIETIKLLNESFLNKYELLVTGVGSELENIRKYIKTNKISNVKLLGYVYGRQKHDLLMSSDILIFPSFSAGLILSAIMVKALSFY